MGMKNPWTINDPASFHPFVRSKQTIPSSRPVLPDVWLRAAVKHGRRATASAARRVLEGRSQPYDAGRRRARFHFPLPGLPYSEQEAKVGSPSKTVLMTP